MIEFVLKSGDPDSDRKGCVDCKFIRGAISLWCTNDEASDARGTSKPGVIDCPYWKPCRTKGELGIVDRTAAAFGFNISYIDSVK